MEQPKLQMSSYMFELWAAGGSIVHLEERPQWGKSSSQHEESDFSPDFFK